MVKFTALVEKFAAQGEKTGWTYIKIPQPVANKLKPNCKKSFRVKGSLNKYSISAMALIPIGEGDFILPLNGDIRKKAIIRRGDTIDVCLQEDEEGYVINKDFIDCLNDEPKALYFFNSLTQGHRNYFSKWIDSAKTEVTKSNRIARSINALAKGWGYPEMIRDKTWI